MFPGFICIFLFPDDTPHFWEDTPYGVASDGDTLPCAHHQGSGQSLGTVSMQTPQNQEHLT